MKKKNCFLNLLLNLSQIAAFITTNLASTIHEIDAISYVDMKPHFPKNL